MGKEVLTVGDNEIEKINLTTIKDVDIEIVLVSNRIYFGEKSY